MKLHITLTPYFFLIPFIFLTHPAKATDYSSLKKVIPASDSSLQVALRFIVEDPQKALLFGHKSHMEARSTDNKFAMAVAQLVLASAYLNQNDADRTSFYIESAKKINNEVNNPDIQFQIFNLKIELLLARRAGIDEFIKLFDGELNQAKISNNTNFRVKLLLLKGKVLSELGEIEKSLETQKQASLLEENAGDEKFTAECFRGIGSTYYHFGQFTNAEEFYSKALSIARKQSDTLSAIEILINFSIVNRDAGKFDESKIQLGEALALANRVGSSHHIAEVYNLLGSLALRMGDHSQSVNYYSQSLSIRERLGYLFSTASTLENISRVYLQLNQYVNAIDALNRAVELRISLGNNRYLASTYNDLGNIYSQKGDLAEALKFYLTSLRIRQELGSDTEISRTLTNIGLTYRKLSSHNNALKYFNQALELTPEKTDPIGKAYIFIHQGNSYRDLNDPKSALKCYQQSLEIRKSTGNQVAVAQAMRSVASAYADLKDFGESKNYLKKSLEIYQTLNDEKGVAEINNEFGNVLLLEEKDSEALVYFELAAELFGKQFELEKRGLCLRKIGEIQLRLGRFALASESLNLALNFAKRTGNGKLMETTYLSLFEYHSTRGSYKEALDFFQKHIRVRDSLQAVNRNESIWQTSFELELGKKADEIRLIENEVDQLRQEAKFKTYEIERQKLKTNFFALAFLFILILASASIYGYYIIRRKNILLNESNAKLALSEQNLKSLVQTKDKLFSIIAHDLRSPFTALVGLTEVLHNQASQLNSEEVSEYSGHIFESSQKLLTLIGNLLDWSRSQTGTITLKPQPVRVNEVFAQTLTLLSMQANAKQIALQTDVDENLTAFTDFDTTFAVVRNLVSNAIKFTENSGKVVLSAQKDGNKVIVKITDSGVGINPVDLTKLFKLDSNISTKGTRNESGTGLGLIVCKEFTELNGGKIWVESEVGVGTTFYVSLPADKKI